MAESGLYLFTGPEIGEKNEAVQNIKAQARKDFGDLDEHALYVSDVSIPDVISQLQNENLFSNGTFITLRNAELIKSKGDIELIASWAKSAGGTSNSLVLISDENSVDKKLEAAVPANHKKMFWEMQEGRKPQWVKEFFRKNGFSVTDGAVDSILEMIENNTDTLKAECSRFFYCFEKGHVVNEDDVESILSHNREESAFTLFDAMANTAKSQPERLESAMEILHKIRLSKDSGSVAIIAGLTYCFRQLREWHALHHSASGETKRPSDAELRASGFYSKTSQRRFERAAKAWNAGQAYSVIALLSHTDMAIRQEGNSMEDTRLTMLIYSIVMKNGLFCSEYELE